MIWVYLQTHFHKMLHYINISDAPYNKHNKPRMVNKLQHLQIIPNFENSHVKTASIWLSKDRIKILSKCLPEIVCIILTIDDFTVPRLIRPAKHFQIQSVKIYSMMISNEIIHSHDFLPLPILAILCSLVLVRSFSSGFLFEVHSSVESVSKEMAGAGFGTLLLLSLDMEEVACRTTLPRRECFSSSNSGLLSEYNSTCRTGSPSELQHVQHAESSTLKI